MPPSRSLPRWAPVAALAVAAGLLLPRLSAFGIWDPWEIEIADLARKIATGKDVATSHAGPWLVAQGFRLLGVDEWTGRLPIALCALLAVAFTYFLVAHFADRRAGLYAALIATSSPLFLFNARTMLGEAPAFAAQTAIALCASLTVFGRDLSRAQRLGWLAATLLLTALSVATRGALLCALPPIAAVATLALLEGRLRATKETLDRALCAGIVCALGIFLGAMVVRDVLADGATFSIWLGGQVVKTQPPTFDATIDHTFHAFAPWSALLPLGLARLVWSNHEADREERSIERVLLLWMAFGYAALTLYTSRYGARASVIPIAALAATVALFLREVEKTKNPQWPAAIAMAFLSGLIIRDFALYPSGPVEGMSLPDFEVPKEWNPKRYWAITVGIFGAVGLLGLGARDGTPLALKRPYQFFAEQWRRGISYKLWLLALALVLIGIEVFGLVCIIGGKSLPLTTLALKWAKRLMFLPPAIPLLIALVQVLFTLWGKLGEFRSVPILCAGLGVGAYAAHGFLPALSTHLSPREIYETYNELATKGEALIEYKVGNRAAAYYAKGEAIEVDTLSQCVEQLAQKGRRWAVLPADELAPVDRMFRTRTGRHVFVADARNARVMLIANQQIGNRVDQNFLSKFVMREPPVIQHKVSATFDGKIELLGYDLKLPHGDHVGPGESFEITWYWKVLKPIPGSYRVFLHIDANSQRIGGDHDPVGGKYPVRLWAVGDVIADHQKLDVPRNYDADAYTMFVGFYSGDTRMPVTAGAKDDADRANAGVLRIR